MSGEEGGCLLDLSSVCNLTLFIADLYHLVVLVFSPFQVVVFIRGFSCDGCFNLGQDQLLHNFGMSKTRVCACKQPNHGQTGKSILRWIIYAELTP